VQRASIVLVCRSHLQLADLTLPETMPPRERRRVDAVIEVVAQPPRIFEFYESQRIAIAACRLAWATR
jgi:hypothetical protein